jgi:hypothetical protein
VKVVEDSTGASSSSRAAFPIGLGRAAISSPEGFQRQYFACARHIFNKPKIASCQIWIDLMLFAIALPPKR